jgi:carbonic anhydrase
MALAILTCMDKRLLTARSMGLGPDEAFVLRNAGGRVTDDVLRSLTAACALLDVRTVAVVHHTDCKALAVEDGAMRRVLTARLGADPGPVRFLGHRDLEASVREDVAAIEACTTIPPTVAVSGWVYDVTTHRLHPVHHEERPAHHPAGVDPGRPPTPARASPWGYRSSDEHSW